MAKKIMFQGTGSTVGKSLIVAAMCRILNDEGYRVAPFKSQNMALNSFITKDGKEMGRAQVVQAEAARIEPDVSMNPILLKPTSYVGSQIILNGQVYQNMKASEYFSQKDFLIPHIRKAFNHLNQNYDVIVIEGAGSPAEINLRSRDIVNMGLAEIVDTDVLLIGDVDKGGVFASIYGTYMLLSEEERKRIKGFVINKFRGDVSLLVPGVKMIEEKIGIPCVGIIPFIENLKIDDEDSVSERLFMKSDKPIKVGVVRLPYMSNFSDFTVFDMESDVSLEYVTTEAEINECDLLIIPGSKNTIFDMQFIIKHKINQAIYRFYKAEKPIFGICGGYQILGNSISDPDSVESIDDLINGLGLLNVETVMATEKTTVQSEATIQNDYLNLNTKDMIIKGYEIHMGETIACGSDVVPFAINSKGEYDGAIDETGRVMGTYFHGIFDNDEFRGAILNKIRSQKGIIEVSSEESFEKLKDQEYDRLAEHVKQYMDMKLIKAFLEESRQLDC